MRAFILTEPCDLKQNPNPLELADLPVPVSEGREILVKVSACGICHTELDEIEGKISPIKYPVIPGHQIIGYKFLQ